MRIQPFILSLLPLAAVASVVGAFDSNQPKSFDRFQVILTRMPFGTAPVAPPPVASTNPAAPQQAQEDQLSKKIQMSAVNRTPNGETAVGFSDLTQNPPRNYYLGIGESSDGFTVIYADCRTERATISKDDVEVTLQLGKGMVLASSPPPAAVEELPAPEEQPATLDGPLAGYDSYGKATANPDEVDPEVTQETEKPRESYADALERRRKEILREKEIENQKIRTVAEKEMEETINREIMIRARQSLRAQNLDLIRNGQPGLPIELTPEEDALLVKEGALPAQ